MPTRKAGSRCATTIQFALRLAMLALAACSGGGGGSPTSTPPTSVLTVSTNPTAIVAGPCPPSHCGSLTGQLEATTSLTIQETAGVGGQVSRVDVSLRGNGSGATIASGSFDAGAVASLAGGSNRVAGRGSLLIQGAGVHFPATSPGALPGTLTIGITFVDDNGHSIAITETLGVS